MASQTDYPFTDLSAPVRIVTSKDRQRTVAVRMDDALHALCWGRLYVAVPVGTAPAEVLSAAEATAWVERERNVRQVSTKDRLVALRASWAPKLEDAA